MSENVGITVFSSTGLPMAVLFFKIGRRQEGDAALSSLLLSD
jgi:hypothetical protein